MKALFTGFLNVSVSGAILILMALILRFFFKKTAKNVLCLLWVLIFVRLLIPVQLEAGWSMRPNLPTLSEGATGIFQESPVVYADEVPAGMPTEFVDTSFGNSLVRVDYVQLFAWIWGGMVVLFGLYTIISYLRLKLRVREAIRIRDNIFSCPGLDTAFLLGYMKPRIYIPAHMGEETSAAVIVHEQMHRKRADNWLKLLGFVCVALHWYNPLVWIAYVMLCKDIEYACDEAVIRDMDTEERKAYAAALLSCGKQRFQLTTCPVAFGEVGLKGRIRNALSYKKPTVWIVSVCAVLAAIFAVFFVTDPVPEHPPYYNQLIELVGQPRQVVAEQLGMELVAHPDYATDGYYDLPVRVTYQGIDFDVTLGFSIIDDCLWSFQYTVIYDNNLQQGAEDTVKLAKHLQKTYGKATQNANKRTLWLSDITVEAVLDKFANKYKAHEGVDTVGGLWSLNGELTEETKAYYEAQKQAEYWQNTWEDRNVALGFGLDFYAWHDDENHRVYICIEYRTAYQFGQTVQEQTLP